MEAHKSGKGRVVLQSNYEQSYQIRNRKFSGCGELGHFVRDWPTKRRSNRAELKPKTVNWGQRPVTGIWTDGSIVSKFKPENKCCHEIARKISASNLQEGFSSGPSDFSEDYSSSVSDSSEDYSSSDFSDSVEDYSFAAYGNRSEDYSPSASESSSALHSFEVYSSSVSDSSQFSSSSASDSCIVYSSSNTDKSEGQDLNEFKDLEEIQTLQCATGVDSLSQITGQVSKASLDPAECHKTVQTMHNLSVLLLVNSSFSDNLSESDIQILQSVICNISQCLLKSTGVSKSTDVAAFMPDKQLVAANSGKTEKDCFAAEGKEDPVGPRSFQMSAEGHLSQMVNIEEELNLIKSEIRCLRTKLEMEGIKKADAGIHEHGDIETLANRNAVNNGSCPEVNSEVNLVMKENDFDYTCAPFSKERSHWLPDLNLDPIMDDESFIGECYIKKYEDNAISQNDISEEPIQKSSLNTTSHNPGQPNAEAETKQIEDYFRVLQEPWSCCDSHIEYIRDYMGNNLVEDGTMTECLTKIVSQSLESYSTWEEINSSEEDHI